jgi:hypothetical protein
MGWGNQYSFCSDKLVRNNLDKEINKRITKYLHSYTKAKGAADNDSSDIRRLLGVQLLADCKSNPIE